MTSTKPRARFTKASFLLNSRIFSDRAGRRRTRRVRAERKDLLRTTLPPASRDPLYAGRRKRHDGSRRRQAQAVASATIWESAVPTFAASSKQRSAGGWRQRSCHLQLRG